jgi:hypothetical protein
MRYVGLDMAAYGSAGGFRCNWGWSAEVDSNMIIV